MAKFKPHFVRMSQHLTPRQRLQDGIERARHDAECSLAAQLRKQFPEMTRADALISAAGIIERNRTEYFGYL